MPLHKAGSVNDNDNYRGITLLSSISKVFTGIINDRLFNWVEEFSKVAEEQAGFL